MGKRTVEPDTSIGIDAPDPFDATERNRRRRHRKAHDKAWKAQTKADGKSAHGMPRIRRQANALARRTRDQKIRKRAERGRGR